jgi:hypothetical protein
MVHPGLVLIAATPLIYRLATIFLPQSYLEPYGYFDTVELNRVNGQSSSQWTNAGWWEVGSEQIITNDSLLMSMRRREKVCSRPSCVLMLALASKLLGFANATYDSVLGESMVEWD